MRTLRGVFAFAIGVLSIASASVAAQPATAPSRVTIDEDNVLAINGRKVFPIGFTLPPAPDAKAFNGKPALEEFRDAGAVFIRTGPSGPSGKWDEAWIAQERAYMDAAARAGMYCMPYLKELAHVEEGDRAREERLRRVVRLFKDHPGMGVWKGADEPQLAKTPVPPLLNAYRIVKEEDSNHPVWIVQAPRGTVEELKAYNAAYDIGGVDVYPIGYPPGTHVPDDDNHAISMIGDYAQKTARVMGGEKPFWFTLQIAWSGVIKPGRTLRFPTFHEQRFMTYQAIINGARGLVYFGGSLPTTLNERDRELGWNWTYWQRVLRPVIEEIGDKGPLAEALVQPDSTLAVKANESGIELCVREAGGDVFVLACSREPQRTMEVTFTGLPNDVRGEGAVLYESPRNVATEGGAFKDWFAPYDVHVYRFRRS